MWQYKYVSSMLKFYRQAKQFFIDHPNGILHLDWCTELNAQQWQANNLKALHERINAKSPELAKRQTWRKFGCDYQRDLLQDSIDLENIARSRTRVYQFRTDCVRSRLSHLLSNYND